MDVSDEAGDNEKVLSLMSGDVIFLRAAHEPMIGKESFAANAPGAPNQFEGTSDIKEGSD